MKHLLTIALGAFSLWGTTTTAADGLYVGGDISVLQSYEDHNVSYYDQQGAAIDDVLKYMKSDAVGWNAQRVRLFVNPQKKGPDGNTDAQVCQDLNYVIRLGQRIKAEGFALMLDFHYSDTWADPPTSGRLPGGSSWAMPNCRPRSMNTRRTVWNVW